METKNQKKVQKSRGISAALVIFGCAIIAVCFFWFVCGNPAGFDEKGAPLPGNFFATMFKGGFVVPIILTLLCTVIALSIERAFAFAKMKGKKNQTKFVQDVKVKLAEGDIRGAREMCDKQQGTVANILNAGLIRYEDVEKIEGLNNDAKAAIIQKEIEEATALEMPSMQQNLPVIAVISTLGTLFGLFGTVLGMIRAFSALGQEGAPDPLALSTAISEALINTATGIATGAMAIIFYNYFAAKVEDITNAVDEIGFAIGQTYTTKHLNK